MIHRAGTPLNNNNRDIIRFMYGPNDGYFMPMLIPINYFPVTMTAKQMFSAGFGRHTEHVLLSLKNSLFSTLLTLFEKTCNEAHKLNNN